MNKVVKEFNDECGLCVKRCDPHIVVGLAIPDKNGKLRFFYGERLPNYEVPRLLHTNKEVALWLWTLKEIGIEKDLWPFIIYYLYLNNTF